MIGFSYMRRVLLDLNLQILGGAFHSRDAEFTIDRT